MMNKDDKMVFFVRNSGETTMVSISAQSSLIEAVEAFERFLRGAGYYFDERLDFVPVEEDKLGSAYEEENANPTYSYSGSDVFGSNDWENSINFDLQNMGDVSLTVSDDIDLTNINLDIQAGTVDQIPGFGPTDNFSFTSEDVYKFHSAR